MKSSDEPTEERARRDPLTSARAEVERLVVELGQRDQRITELEEQLARHRSNALAAEIEQAHATIGALRRSSAKLRGAARAANRDATELITWALPVVHARHGATPHAMTRLREVVEAVLREGAERNRLDPDLAAEVLGQRDELVAAGSR